MFCGMSLTAARTGRKGDLVAAALDHAAALRRQPGCSATYVLEESEGSGVVAMSIFDSEDAFQRAVAATRAVIGKHHLEELVEGVGEFRTFRVRDAPPT